MHAREGRLFQEVIIAALDRAEIPYRVLSDRTARIELAGQLRVPERRLWDSISRAGQGVVQPWRIDEKLAVVGALYAMSDRTAANDVGA